jgi:hypothetical protein
MDMKDKEPKIHPLVRVGSTLTALALAASQVGCKPLGVESPPPEGTQARSTEVVPPLSSTVEVAAPVSIQPMVEETPVAGATSTPESVSPAVWAPPTLEQMAVTGYGGELSPDVAVYEFDKVIPTGLARVGIENTTVNFSNNGLSGDAYRWAPLTVNPEGLVIWAYDPAIGQLEWPVKLDPLVDAAGNTYYRLRTEGLSYQAVPDSEGAQIVWGGTKDGKSGEYLAILAKDPLTLPDGKQIYSTYWDRTSQSWLSTPGLAELMLPPLPEEFLSQIPKDSYTYDANGLHLTVAERQVVDIPSDKITDRIKNGQASPLQIYTEAETAILYAYDAENKTWVDAAKVLQPDNSNVENYIEYDTLDDWLKSARLEKMVLPPFDPATTYFPDPTKIYTTDWNNLNSGHYTDSEFNFSSPFGNLPENMQSPFRTVNFVNIGNGKSYGFTEQIYNPSDGSFTLIHIPLDNVRPDIIDSVIRITASGRYNLPVYFADPELLSNPSRQNTITWLKTNGYMDSSGNMPKIKAWIDEWLTTGYLSPEMENIPILYRPKAFQRE